MKSKEEVLSILNKAYDYEVLAQKNCEELLKFLHENGFPKAVEHIKQDEIEHQKWVKQLIGFIKKQ